LVLAIAVVSLGPASRVAAHTGFESSTPADSATVAEPVTDVFIVFTGPATPVGDGFVALDPDGVIRTPSNVATDDDMTFRLEFEPPLVGGAIGVRWEVQAPDAHPIEGAFSFTVTAGAPTTTSTVPEATTNIVDDAATTAATTTATAGTTTGTDPPTALDDFLTVDNSRPGETTQLIGRIITLLAAMLALGGTAFLATTFRGSTDELRSSIGVLRTLGALVSIGALIEYVGFVSDADESFTSAWTSTPGVAMGLRLLGGVLLAVGLRSDSSGSAPNERWVPGSSPVALGGAAVILASFWFDGHTVSKGLRPLHALVNTVHVGAGAVWVGGIVAIASVIWRRSRRGVPARAAELVVRFSHIATVALVAVISAGVVMAITVLDSLGELTSTEWGQILLLKMGAVAVAACFGTYNHFRLRPALEAAPGDPELTERLRAVLTAEAIVLGFVVVVTTWLVAAAS
jgi:copper transport protein